MRVLVVEDAPSGLKLPRIVLTSEGHQVGEAETAEKALRAIREKPPELRLADLRLPGMSGLALTRRLKQVTATRDIPVIAIASYPDSGIQQEALEAGCSAFLIEPIDTKILARHIADTGSELGFSGGPKS